MPIATPLNTSGHSLLIVRKILAHVRVKHGPLASNWITYGNQTSQNPLRSNYLGSVLKVFYYMEPKRDNKQRAGKTPWWHVHQITFAGSKSLLEEQSNKGRNLRRTSSYLQTRGSKESKIRRPLLSCERPGDLLSVSMETTLSKEGKQASHLSRYLGQGHGPYSKWSCWGNGR